MYVFLSSNCSAACTVVRDTGPANALSMIVSLGLLGLALKNLPLGTAYAIWVGIGTIGTVAAGIWLLGEDANPLRLACVGLIALGIAGLKLTA